MWTPGKVGTCRPASNSGSAFTETPALSQGDQGLIQRCVWNIEVTLSANTGKARSRTLKKSIQQGPRSGNRVMPEQAIDLSQIALITTYGPTCTSSGAILTLCAKIFARKMSGCSEQGAQRRGALSALLLCQVYVPMIGDRMLDGYGRVPAGVTSSRYRQLDHAAAGAKRPPDRCEACRDIG